MMVKIMPIVNGCIVECVDAYDTKITPRRKIAACYHGFINQRISSTHIGVFVRYSNVYSIFFSRLLCQKNGKKSIECASIIYGDIWGYARRKCT